jgi:serine/threonine-protein phosphatase 6 regulatory ankyrin repeat subunit A/serine/threonine-protein phosphatase 6 regulatory ankyrin repeat subunit B
MHEKKKSKQLKIPGKKDERFYNLRNAAFANLPEARRLIQEDPTIVTAKNSLGETAFHFLVVENQLEAVVFLVQHGSDVNNKNLFGRPAIVEAAQLGHVEMVNLLLNLHATVNVAEMIEEMDELDLEEEKQTEIIAVLEKHGYKT